MGGCTKASYDMAIANQMTIATVSILAPAKILLFVVFCFLCYYILPSCLELARWKNWNIANEQNFCPEIPLLRTQPIEVPVQFW